MDPPASGYSSTAESLPCGYGASWGDFQRPTCVTTPRWSNLIVRPLRQRCVFVSFHATQTLKTKMESGIPIFSFLSLSHSFPLLFPLYYSLFLSFFLCHSFCVPVPFLVSFIFFWPLFLCLPLFFPYITWNSSTKCLPLAFTSSNNESRRSHQNRGLRSVQFSTDFRRRW